MYKRFIIDTAGNKVMLNDIPNYTLQAEGNWISVAVLSKDGEVQEEYVLHQENDTYAPI